MIDRYGRNINKLRVSVGEACNLSCVYCVSELNGHQVSNNALNAEELLKLIGLLKNHTGIEKIRITGGEPVLFRPLPILIKGIVDLGISNIGMTSNGYITPKLAQILKNAGLQSINISLDSVNPSTFSRLTRNGKLKKVLTGIENILAVGIKVKINAVVIGGENDQELNEVLDYAFPRGIEVRFLELMKMGPLFENIDRRQGTPDQFVPMAEMLAHISGRYPYQPIDAPNDSTALRFKTTEGTFGIIPNESAPFCSTCSRMRLTSTGKLVGCLSNPTEFSIRHLKDGPDPETELQDIFTQAMSQKQVSSFTGSSLVMSSIGG